MRSRDKEKKERENSNALHLRLGSASGFDDESSNEHGVGRVRTGEHRTAGLFNYKRVIIVRRRNRLRLGIFHTVVGDALLAAVWAIAKSMNLKVDINDHAAPNLCFEDASGKIRHLS